jgi:hypothetical protein
MNLDSKVMEYIAAQEAGYIIVPSDLIKEFQLKADDALGHLVIAFKAGFVVPCFKLFDQPWCQNLLDIPAVVETADGPHIVTPQDVVVGYQRTDVQ